jgi:hypothetical protein
MPEGNRRGHPRLDEEEAREAEPLQLLPEVLLGRPTEDGHVRIEASLLALGNDALHEADSCARMSGTATRRSTAPSASHLAGGLVA